MREPRKTTLEVERSIETHICETGVDPVKPAKSTADTSKQKGDICL